MKKEEILTKSRNEKFDEREDRIVDNSYFYSTIGVLGVSVLIILWNIIHRKPYADLTTIICVSISGSALFKYKETKRKKFLIAGVLGLAATIDCLILYFVFGA